jgi:hypothetical protein
MDLDVRMVKIANDDTVQLVFQRPSKHAGGFDVANWHCKDKPKQELFDALQALAPTAIAICQFPESYAEGLKVRAAHVSYDKKGVRGLVLTCSKMLDTAPSALTFNTPYLAEKEISGEETTMARVLPEGTAEKIDELLSQARLYIAGERLQTQLEFSNGEAVGAE